MHPDSPALPAARSAEDIRSEIMQLIEEYAGVLQVRAAEVNALPSTQIDTAPVTGAELTILPGTVYARYGLPLDYPPSRDYRPRWGWTHPPIASLNEWFAGQATKYEAFLEEMTRSLPGSTRYRMILATAGYRSRHGLGCRSHLLTRSPSTRWSGSIVPTPIWRSARALAPASPQRRSGTTTSAHASYRSTRDPEEQSIPSVTR
jgi:hypothetical protein